MMQYFALNAPLIYSSLHLAAHHKPYASTAAFEDLKQSSSAAAFEDLKQSSPAYGDSYCVSVVLFVAATTFKA